MRSDIRVKICGLTGPEHVRAAVDAGAGYVGFVFFPKSPRHIDAGAAGELAHLLPAGVAKVALTVNATDQELDNVVSTVPLDMLQLHGEEGPERVAKIRHTFGLPVMKAVGVAEVEDLAAIDLYSDVADQLLIDAKQPRNAELPGGNGLSFDWRLLAGRKYWRKPWMLAGGLTPDNVAEALRMTGAQQVDVSSGVESAPGIKDAALIRAFIEATR